MKEKGLFGDLEKREKELQKQDDNDNKQVMSGYAKYAAQKGTIAMKPAKKYKKGYFF